MRLLKMRLENFKGIRKAEFVIGGKNANIFGANGSGKTTVNDAFTWLLFGKSSEDKKNFTPQTITKDGQAHNLQHSVECELDIDGEIDTFKRVYHEVYKKTRGRAEAEFSGYTTEYFINDVPKKESEYKKYWEGIFPNDEVVKLLTMPAYFSEGFSDKKRRPLLFEMCGTISDTAIMEADDELREELLPLLNGNTVDDYRKTAVSQRATVNKRLNVLPDIIAEAEKAVPDTAGVSQPALEERLAAVRKEISETEKIRADILSGNREMSRVKAQLSELEYKLSEAKRQYAEKQQSADSEAYGRIQIIRNSLTSRENYLAEAKSQLENEKKNYAEIERKRNEIFAEHRSLQEEYNTLQSETFDESLTVCDKCGQPLPTDEVIERRENFNERKSAHLTELTRKMNDLVNFGRENASKEMLASSKEAIDKLTEEITAKENDVRNYREKLKAADETLQKSKRPPFEQTEEYAAITAKISKVRETGKSSEPDTTEADNKIASLREEEAAIMSKLAALETEKTQKARVEELEREEKELGQKFCDIERAVYLCDRFSLVKSSLLSDKINERFSTVRFQLFKQNITNDGIEEICDVLVPSESGALVPFGDANRAARLNAGIEIIGVLSEYYGIELPIFVDNAESVTNIIPTKAQMIRLIVLESDKELRMETV